MNTVLFDLDGTLLQMEQDEFIAAYFKALVTNAAKMGYSPELTKKAVTVGIAAMAKNDGESTNEDLFWQAFNDILGEKAMQDKAEFIQFYTTDFKAVKAVSVYNEYSNKIVSLLKQKGYRLILATMPMFPREGTYERMSWAGISPADFELVTTYEDCKSTKPHLAYYKNIMERQGLRPQDCMMVGNNTDEDMPAKELGMDTYLVTDYIINKSGKDISEYKNGSLADFYEFAKGLPDIKA